MIPFYEEHSPLEIALETMLDAIWCIAWVVGFTIALWQHFAAPVAPADATAPIIDPLDVALPYSALPEAAPAKPRRTRKKATVS